MINMSKDTNKKWAVGALIAGVDMKVVSEKLEKEGVEKFQQAFRSMLDALKS